jgi:hypothetical protein
MPAHVCGHEAAGDAAHVYEALRRAAGVRLDGDRRHPAAHKDGHMRMPGLVDRRGEQLERIGNRADEARVQRRDRIGGVVRVSTRQRKTRFSHLTRLLGGLLNFYARAA